MVDTTKVNGIEDALAQCGVTKTTLGVAETTALDQLGYVVLPDVIDADWLKRLRAEFERALGQGQGKETTNKQTGTRHVNNLIRSDTAFDIAYTHPKVLAAVYYVLRRPFKVFQLGGRDPLPGSGQQGLHTDWLPRTSSEPFYIVTALWLLDDYTESNGATRLIPGSHLMPKPLPKPMQQPESRHRDQKIITARASSVLVFNGHLWHSGTRNDSKGPRRILQCQFIARELGRPDDSRLEIPPWLTPAARYILGV